MISNLRLVSGLANIQPTSLYRDVLLEMKTNLSKQNILIVQNYHKKMIERIHAED